MIPKNTNKQNRKKVIIFYASQNIYDWGSNLPPPSSDSGTIHFLLSMIEICRLYYCTVCVDDECSVGNMVYGLRSYEYMSMIL